MELFFFINKKAMQIAVNKKNDEIIKLLNSKK